MAEQEGKTIHSVAKAIRLLDLLTAAGQPASLTELYQKTGWPKSTIHGLLSTMRESGLIEQTPNGRYWLGIRLFEYGCAVSNSWDIGAIARPHMQNICTELCRSTARRRASCFWPTAPRPSAAASSRTPSSRPTRPTPSPRRSSSPPSSPASASRATPWKTANTKLAFARSPRPSTM